MPRRRALPLWTLVVLLQLVGCLLSPCLEVCHLYMSTESFCFSGVASPSAWEIHASSLLGVSSLTQAHLLSKAAPKAIEVFEVNAGLKNTREPEPTA